MIEAASSESGVPQSIQVSLPIFNNSAWPFWTYFLLTSVIENHPHILLTFIN